MLLVLAVSSPLLGLAAAEDFENRKLFGVVEGDWFALVGVVIGAASLWFAVKVAGQRS